MSATVLVLGGDGVGPEVTAQAVRVLQWLQARGELDVEIIESPYGFGAWRSTGAILPAQTLEAVHAADAVLFGAIGDAYTDVPLAVRRDGSILRLRQELGLYANLRPVRYWPALAAACPLRSEIARGTDIAIVRENIGGLYFGKPRGSEILADGRVRAFNTLVYSSDEIERVARFALGLARRRTGKLHSVDKSNVLETGALWRRVLSDLHEREFADVALHHMLVDNCAMQLVREPGQFDVIVTENMFGDILSDGAGAIAGSLGMLPSASLGDELSDGRWPGIYEPVHGSAPDIAGMGIANPVGAILSLALALRHSLRSPSLGAWLEHALEHALASGARTADIAAPGETVLGTAALGDRVLSALELTAEQRPVR